MTSGLENFIGMYPISKTLRFELIPQGETEQWIEKNGVLERDKMLAQDYQLMKDYIDDYHRDFISTVLERPEINIDWTELADALDAFQVADANTRDKARDALSKAQEKSRKVVAGMFENPKKHGIEGCPGCVTLFSAEFIKELLPAYYSDERDKVEIIDKFHKFSAYFKSFFEKRALMYSNEEKFGSIAHRVVNQNFVTFYQNVKTYRVLKEAHPELLAACERELEGVFGEFGMDSVFELSFFNRVLPQSGIESYNAVFGGVSLEDGKHVRGLNQYLNEAGQRGELSDSCRRLRFVPLYKQILTKSESLSFVIDKLDNDSEASNLVIDLINQLGVNKPLEDNVIYGFANEIATGDFDLEKIYVPANDLPKLSVALGRKWSVIPDAVSFCASSMVGPAAGMKKAKAEKWGKQKQFSVAEIACACVAADAFVPEDLLAALGSELKERLQKAQPLCKKAVEVCGEYMTTKRLLLEDEANFEPLKKAVEALLQCNDLVKLFSVDYELDRDAGFYAAQGETSEQTRAVVAVLNKLRNYITQNPYSEEKFKLNFDIQTLAAGWDVNKEAENRTTILLKDGRYYLGIIDKSAGKPFRDVPAADDDEPCYRKMVYKLLSGPNKMLPKVFFSKKGREAYEPSDYILEGYEAGKYKKGDNFDLKFCHDLIDFFKENIVKYPGWEVFDFNFSDTNTYANIAEFYDEVARDGYRMNFVDVPVSYIDEMVREGKIYLFQIYNKDFSEFSTGRKNLHTLYFESLFDEENLKNVVFKLDGEAKLFYRPASIKNPYSHKLGEKLVNKTYVEDGVTLHVPDDVYMEIFNHVNGKLDRERLSFAAKSLLDSGKVVIKDVKHEIIKDRRYTQPKYGFHVPLTINFGSKGISNINYRVLEYLHNNPEVNIIGINRGERNLIYAAVINQAGEILEQRSFNVVNGVDYQVKLDAKEAERTSNRQNWKKIGQIKQIKEGYLSLVVPEVAKMMVKYNAIVVLEDLSQDFKNSRVKIEKQVHQKFEKALVDKLNYFAQKPAVGEDDEGVGIYEPGGIARGYQLANKFESLNALGRQSGFMFYVSPWNTSNLDPSTGFANLFKKAMLSYVNVDTAKSFFNTFNRIAYSVDEGYFEFEFEYSRFKQVSQCDYTNKWTACTYGSRIIKRKVQSSGRWTSETVDVTEELKTLCDEISIDYKSGKDIKNDICLKFGKNQFVKLYELFAATVQLRNSDFGGVEDYILSPIKNSSGYFYDSRYADASKLPKCGDANDAFNIARKALKLLQEHNANEPVAGVYKLPPLAKGENDRWLKWAQENAVS